MTPGAVMFGLVGGWIVGGHWRAAMQAPGDSRPLSMARAVTPAVLLAGPLLLVGVPFWLFGAADAAAVALGAAGGAAARVAVDEFLRSRVRDPHPGETDVEL